MFQKNKLSFGRSSFRSFKTRHTYFLAKRVEEEEKKEEKETLDAGGRSSRPYG